MNLIIVIPCYNEEEVLPLTRDTLLAVIDRMVAAGAVGEGRLLCVDDGSRDGTWALIEEYAAADPRVMGLKLSHNEGHQHALWAGLERAAALGADAVVSIDADLQDDPWAIPRMAAAYHEGADVVYGVRGSRASDTWFKRTTAQAFYRLMRCMGSNVVYNHADFRLMSLRAVRALLAYPERNLFLRGMVASLGFSSAIIEYTRTPRRAGTSKYPFFRMLAFAADGITSFSIRPLQYILWLGLIFITIALVAILYGLTVWAEGRTISGWTTLFVSLWFIGGAILVACSIIGEYVGKIYIEVKRRPRYFVDRSAGAEGQGGGAFDQQDAAAHVREDEAYAAKARQ